METYTFPLDVFALNYMNYTSYLTFKFIVAVWPPKAARIFGDRSKKTRLQQQHSALVKALVARSVAEPEV